ncbi:hypothetical protein [Streptomyces sp. NPDC001792]|uniref:hypothetical protein n=1 Tax=unclassified Streptomyces TaxID=2593676 RepID=UPI0033240F0A
MDGLLEPFARGEPALFEGPDQFFDLLVEAPHGHGGGAARGACRSGHPRRGEGTARADAWTVRAARGNPLLEVGDLNELIGQARQDIRAAAVDI